MLNTNILEKRGTFLLPTQILGFRLEKLRVSFSWKPTHLSSPAKYR